MKKITLLILASLMSMCGYAQLALEGFENPWTGTPGAPPGWTVVNEEGPSMTWVREITSTQKPSNNGSYAAYLDRENVATGNPIPKDWLITPYFNMPANAQLRFFSRLTVAGDQGGTYKVKISTDPDPTNLASYTDLQTWTETTINPLQTSYYEKVITLPAISGSAHIAFVMEGDNCDRWLIDDVKVTAQCTDPTTLTVSAIDLDSATFNWANPGGATSWEVEVIPELQAPTQVGTPHNGPAPFTKEGLQPGTNYKVYLKAICSDGGQSNWIGPVYFKTGNLGDSCNYPLPISGLPFSTTNNTSNFSDVYEGAPGSTCGTTGTYLSGNDVVYTYNPTVTGNITINLTNTGTGAAMFVYSSCANIGVACIGGGIGNVSIPTLAVTAGSSIYIVISTNTSATTTPYTLTIQQVYCAPPTGLAASNPTPTSGDLTWGAGTATAWQLAVQPAGASLPTGPGINVTSNTITASATVTGDPLQPATAYQYYVRASCGDGTYSIWSGPFAFSTTQIPTTIPYAQDWETGPHNWSINNGTQVNKWVVGNAVNNGGSQSLYISNDNGVSNTYTITSASVVHAYRDVIIPSGATSLNLAFNWRSIGETAANDYIRAYLLPVSVIPVPGTQIVGSATNIKIGADLYNNANWSTFNGVVDVSAIQGQTRRLVLEWRNTAATGAQPPAAIDNINFTVITCPAPTAPQVVAGTLTNSSVNISWGAPTSVPSQGYQYYLSTSQTPPVATTPETGTSASTTASNVPLQPSTTYYFWVRANCGAGDTSTWTGPLSFIAPQIPATMDYAQNFDGASHGWALSNGTQTNKWVVGSATSNSATNSLYISQDNGTTNTYNVNSGSVVHAYRDITIPAGVDQLELTYDWKSVAESATFDWIRVWIAPTTFNPTPSTAITTANATQIGTSLSLNSTWTTLSNIIQAGSLNLGGSTRRLIFEWRNDGVGGNQPPAAIDNINFKVIQCPQPSALAMTNLTVNDATFTWTPPTSGATGYEYYISTNATAPTASTTISGSSATATVSIPNLPASTTHYIWVRTDCTTSKSYWIGPISFLTPQVPATVNYSQNFDMGTHNWDFINGTQTNKWVVGNAVSNSAPNSMYISSDNGTTNTYNLTTTTVAHAYRDITIPNPAEELVLSFDWRGMGESNIDYFKIWLVPTSYIPAAGTAIVAGTGRIQIGGNFQLNSIWQTSNTIIPATAIQGQTMRLVFEWRNSASGGQQPPAAIDNINLSIVTCPASTNLQMPINNTGGATFTWTPPATVSPTYEYYYSQSATPPGAATVALGTSPTPAVTLSGLPESTTYYFWVRNDCGSGGKSLWLGPYEFNTPLTPVSLNYDENFDGPTHGWVIKNGTQTNRWFVGNATFNSAANSLYISDNGGLTNTYTVTTASTVHAYKDFIIPTGTTAVDLSFDWKSVGQASVDFIKVWRVIDTYIPTPGTAITASGTDRQLLGTVSNNANWTNQSYILNTTAYAGTNMRIIFEWTNNAFTGDQPAGAIDNINLTLITCPKPTALGATASTQTGATFNWTEAGTATAWEVYVTTPGSQTPLASTPGVSAPSNPFVYSDPAIQPSSNYVYYVRAVCNPGEKSKWSGPFAFQTAIGNDECTGAYTLLQNPYGQECQSSSTAMYTGATPSPQPFTCGGSNAADIWYSFVATSDRANIELSNFAINTTASQAVVIELYQGETCGSLLQLECATTNVMMARNLVVGATYKVRCYLNATTPNANTIFTICVNTPEPPSIGNPQDCLITTINPSFEFPLVTGIYPATDVYQNTVQGWRTTASDNRMEFWPVPNMESHQGYEGNQFIELNAYEPSGLYQDYESPAGTVFSYSFGHKGRSAGGPDVLELRAGTPGGTLSTVTVASTGKDNWVTYTGTYTVPAGQTVTRFMFIAISTSATGPTALSTGNFLDGIRFTADNSVVSVTPSAATCIDNVVTVVGSGTGEWSAFATNPSPTEITDANNNTTTITGFAENGEYWYNWTTAYCSSAVKVDYNNGSVPVPVVVSTIDYCEGETPAQLTATELPGNTLNWYTTATGGTADTTAPTPDTAAEGSVTYYVSQKAADQCESPRAAITVNVHAIPAAPLAAPAVEYCEDTTAAQLTAVALTGNTLNWYTTATGGTADTTAPTPSTANAGVTSYYVSQVSPFSCESARTEIVVTVNASILPVTDFTIVQSICQEDVNPVPVPGAGQTPGGYYSSQAGLIINPATGEIDLALSTAGTYTVSYTVYPDPAVCNLGNSSSAQIVIVPLAAAVTGFSYTTPVCSNGANQLPVLDANFTTGGTFTADNGLVVDPVTGEINIAASTPGDNYTITYTVNQSVPNCVAAGTGTASFTITQLFTPVTAFNYDNSFCYNATDASPNLDANFTTGGTFTGTNGLVIDAATGLVDVSSSIPGQHTVTYTFTGDTSNCIEGGSSSTSFTIGTEAEFSFNGECQGTVYVVTATVVTNELEDVDISYAWANAAGATIGTNANTINVTEYTNSTPENDTFPMDLFLTVTINGCETTKQFVVEGIGCSIQKGISPNNDGYNDYFDLEFMGVKKLAIYNRYGQEVYTKDNYKNEWIGQTNKGDELPTGTYYYVIERSVGGTETGWIYINRQE
ncbi:MAG: hypothetical protein DI539_08135 [Flavobacterium psychrophilum]|nr:MAG: hypothetical protein DI539_08135 [Flavobacterium psychrophilum]